MPAKDRRHYQGDYLVRARRVRELANADPFVRCWRCGLLAKPGDPWQAGHVRDGDPASPLLPEHRSCNARAGQALATARRRVVQPRWSRRWY